MCVRKGAVLWLCLAHSSADWIRYSHVVVCCVLLEKHDCSSRLLLRNKGKLRNGVESTVN